jgi:hypothetical protein
MKTYAEPPSPLSLWERARVRELETKHLFLLGSFIPNREKVQMRKLR